MPPGLSHPLWASLYPPATRRKAGLPADALASLSLLQADPLREAGGGRAGFPQLLGDFERWLQVENAKLVRIIAMRTATAQDARARDTKLQVRAQERPLSEGFAPWMV